MQNKNLKLPIAKNEGVSNEIAIRPEIVRLLAHNMSVCEIASTLRITKCSVHKVKAMLTTYGKP